MADAVLWEGYVLYPYRASAAKNQVRWQYGVLDPAAVQRGRRVRALDDADRVRARVRPRGRGRREAPLPPGADPHRRGGRRRRVQAGRRARRRRRALGELGRGRRARARHHGVRPRPARCARGPDPSRRRPRHRAARHGRGGWCASAGPSRRSCGSSPSTARARTRSRSCASPSRTPPTGPTPTCPATRRCGARSSPSTRSCTPTTPGSSRCSSRPSSPGPRWRHAERRHVPRAHRRSRRARPSCCRRRSSCTTTRVVAAESPGDMCDATEIDEILALRILTLTDDEKRLARSTDPRAAAIVDRIEGFSPEVFASLHGEMRAVGAERARARTRLPWWEPAVDAAVTRGRTRSSSPGSAVVQGQPRCGCGPVRSRAAHRRPGSVPRRACGPRSKACSSTSTATSTSP